MAGGNDHIKQGASFVKTNVLQQYYRYRDPCSIFVSPASEGFRRRHRKESNRLTLRGIDTLQEDIFRIFSETLHCDLNILIGHEVICTNECIIKTRSPFFYKIIEPFFDHSEETITCCLNTPGILEEIKQFVRLLYTNFEVYCEEKLLVQLILSVICELDSAERSCTYEISNSKERNHRKVCQECKTLCRCNKKGDSIDVISTSSDMADSGLETGSVSPQETDINSDNSGTEFEESQGVEFTLMDKVTSNELSDPTFGTIHFAKCQYKSRLNHDNIKLQNPNYDATCSSSTAEQQQREFEENAQKLDHVEEIFQYENQVLNYTFYESDGSDDNNQGNSPMPSDSFEFVEPEDLPSIDYNSEEKPENYKEFESEESEHLKSSEKEKKSVESFQSELSRTSESIKSSTTSVNSYFFIDASSLNDDVFPVAMNSTKERGDSLPPYFCPSDGYVPSRTDVKHHRLTNFKSSTSQSEQRETAVFEQELKLNEFLKPLSEPKKKKRVDSALEDKLSEKGTVKEALVVEIKEADSGESTQPSPCPDNAKIVLEIDNQQTGCSFEEHGCEECENQNGKSIEMDNQEADKSEESNQVNDDRRPSLIRRNTFELDSNDEKLSALRQEYERRQGSLVFQNSIPQYSGHRVDNDSCYGSPLHSSLGPTNEAQNFSDQQIAFLSLNKLDHDHVEKETKCNYFSNHRYDQTDTIPMQRSASDKNVTNSQEDLSENCNSLPVTLNSILTRDDYLARRSVRDESIPIISGGARTLDSRRTTDSPTVRRKTESTPIVSGGSVLIPELETKIKSRMSSSMTAWVVDMSTVQKMTKSREMSQSFSTSDCIEKPITQKKTHEKQGSFGFFVDLNDMNAPKEKEPEAVQPKKRDQNGSEKQYCEFFIDMSDSDVSLNSKKSSPRGSTTKKDLIDLNDKKNIFSMFIDFKEPEKTGKKGCGSELWHKRSKEYLPGLSNKRSTERERFERSSTKEACIKPEEDEVTRQSNIPTSVEDNGYEQTPVKEKSKGVFMFIQSDSPVVRRKTLSSSRAPFKRNSWNTDKSTDENEIGNRFGSVSGNGPLKSTFFRKEHKRAQSLSIDRREFRQFQGRASKSSHSLSEAAQVNSVNGIISTMEEENSQNLDTSTTLDVFEYDTQDTPPNSHIEITNEKIRMKHSALEETKSADVGQVKKNYEKQITESRKIWDNTATKSTEAQTKKSETFDISSESGPSPGNENQDFQLSELLNGDVPKFIDRTPIIASTGAKITKTHKSLNEKIKRIESELKGPEFELKQKEESKGMNVDFVRLSDLDSTSTKCSTSNVTVIKETESFTHRMSNSIPETSWIESKLVITRTNGVMKTRPRQFPSHMSTSLPSKQKSPLEDLTSERDAEGIISESDLSSMQSSMGRSGAGSTEETETSSFAGAKPYNRLGEDLLRMFLEEINPDVTIDVAGRKIRAHKCILSSRCQYFAAILSGGWIESTGNIISLQGYSYNAVHFALCHIYSGESNIPDTISIMELATLSDMLCLEGLKEVIGYTLKVKYCHLFHKPCQVCAVGVLECMPLAAAYGLDELYRKSLKWVTRHFVRIWPCKAFATLPRELMDKCYHQHIVHMLAENVLQTIMDCDKLLATLPNVRWAEPVFRLVSNLLDASVKYLSDNFAGVLGSDSFQALGKDLTWNISRLEDNFLLAAERLPPEQACRSYSKLDKMLVTSQADDLQSRLKCGPLFIDFLKRIQNRVEKCLVREAARASRTTSWLKMDLELRRRIQELACLVILPNEATKRNSRHSNFLKDPKIPPGKLSTNRSLDVKKVKTAITEYNGKSIKSTTTTTTTTQQTKRVFNKPKTDPLERKMQEEKSTADNPLRPKSWPNKIEVKSRYLEPRNKSATKGSAVQANQEKVITQRKKIMISSSDSSRTSSPAMKRAIEKKPVNKIKLQIKKDSKALSSDSLADSNATRANNKKKIISKSCGITRPESPSLKRKDDDAVGLSVSSLSDQKMKETGKKSLKMDTSMSTDSLTAENTSGTLKSTVSNKLSPTLNRGLNKFQAYDRAKKLSPPMQSKNTPLARRPVRSLESSTTASRNRAAAAVNAYHGSPNLRRNLLDAAKTPDISAKPLSNVAPRTITRHTAQSATAAFNDKRDKKESLSNSIDSPARKTSLKLNATHKLSKFPVGKKKVEKGIEDKGKPKSDTPKLLTVGSRSGTFLKDEPTILKKADIKSSQIDS
ncbi:uncharacterized protein LOC127290860 isoform X2 [Leptopilina boulardi]|uniref:uncharacterized protein LOC127290860 isoform X2 n=1 Tax=Leptopilina boulardi TaxID=63433 RepID=UPI0021F6979D|nr:uncharacterized protein LOC127290860 isoform X2 [Leptopilina boulardi]